MEKKNLLPCLQHCFSFLFLTCKTKKKFQKVYVKTLHTYKTVDSTKNLYDSTDASNQLILILHLSSSLNIIYYPLKKQVLIGLLQRYALTVDITHTSLSLVSICVSGAESGAFPWLGPRPSSPLV